MLTFHLLVFNIIVSVYFKMIMFTLIPLLSCPSGFILLFE